MDSKLVTEACSLLGIPLAILDIAEHHHSLFPRSITAIKDTMNYEKEQADNVFLAASTRNFEDRTQRNPFSVDNIKRQPEQWSSPTSSRDFWSLTIIIWCSARGVEPTSRYTTTKVGFALRELH